MRWSCRVFLPPFCTLQDMRLRSIMVMQSPLQRTEVGSLPTEGSMSDSLPDHKYHQTVIYTFEPDRYYDLTTWIDKLLELQSQVPIDPEMCVEYDSYDEYIRFSLRYQRPMTAEEIKRRDDELARQAKIVKQQEANQAANQRRIELEMLKNLVTKYPDRTKKLLNKGTLDAEV